MLCSDNPLDDELCWSESSKRVIPVEFMITSNRLDYVLSKRIL